MFEIILWVLVGMVVGGLITGLWAWKKLDDLEYQIFVDKVKPNEGESEPSIETRGRKKGTTPYKCRRCAGTEYIQFTGRRYCKLCWDANIGKRREQARKWYHDNKKEKAGEKE